jgi:hypothetical protein
MGKGNEEKEERSMDKSIEALDALATPVAPTPMEAGTELLKACKACMDKGSETVTKRDMGTVKFGPGGPKFEGGEEAGKTPGKVGDPTPHADKMVGIVSRDKKQGRAKPPPTPADAKSMNKAACPKCGKDDCPCAGKHDKEDCKCPGAMEKAMTSMAVPRLPRAMQHEMVRRNAQSVMTRGNSRFAKDIHTGPLTGEVIEMVEADADLRSGRREVFKACGGCGRRYKLFKGVDGGCPTCQINKSTHCDGCGAQLVKSHGGMARCPLCG